ncbi:MAG: SH3 domain-containing protein [Proteobacteria bacterium]|nr:SH3 domain-containing protein [Pseudomonadota bacterium]
MKRIAPLCLAMTLLAGVSLAQDDAPNPGKAFPHYGSLKKTEVNVRSGPGNQYPILWIYQREGYPVQLLARYDNYYKLRDAEGEEGWAYVGMVSARLTGLVGGKTPVPLHRYAEPDSVVVARLAPGVVVEMGDCENDRAAPVCEVRVQGYKGWVAKKSLLMVD